MLLTLILFLYLFCCLLFVCFYKIVFKQSHLSNNFKIEHHFKTHTIHSTLFVFEVACQTQFSYFPNLSSQKNFLAIDIKDIGMQSRRPTNTLIQWLWISQGTLSNIFWCTKNSFRITLNPRVIPTPQILDLHSYDHSQKLRVKNQNITNLLSEATNMIFHVIYKKASTCSWDIGTNN